MFKAHLIALFGITLVGLFATLALFHPGLYTAHDIWHQVARFYHYTEALKDGQIFPMWIGTLSYGYGYPLFFFSYHLPWLIGAPLVLLGVDLFTALKFVFGFSFIAAGWAMYALVYYLTKKTWPSTVAAALYLWSPFHFLSLYISASIGMVIAFTILPLLVLGLFLALRDNNWKGSVLISLSLAGLILTHFLSAVLLVPFALALVKIPWLAENRKTIFSRHTFHATKKAVIGVILGFLLTAFYLIPLVKYLPTINALEVGRGFRDLYKVNLVNFKQLVYSPWGVGPIVEKATDGEISFQVGIAQWLSIGLAGLLVIWLVYKRKWPTPLLLTTIALYGFSVILMTVQAEPFWRITNNFISIDYPFRLLVVAVFMGSLAAGLVLSSITLKGLQWGIGAFLIVVALYTNRNHRHVNAYTDYPLQLYIDSETTTNTFHEYLPKGRNLSDMKPKDRAAFYAEVPNEEAIAAGMFVGKHDPVDVTDVHQNTRQLSFKVTVASPSAIAYRQFDFVGMHVKLDGKLTPHGVDKQGYIFQYLPAGEHSVEVFFAQNRLIKVGYAISTAAALVLIQLLLMSKRKKV